uniref:Uncharacterized protein n=1 Tax=Chromera velia CCMP2878 TaxID=1169474 RepID=A0A0G4H616_9ALVE|eukprot:Cvel_5730.t1-p1 / transcript=Cvel_5730.t1 / gene=Cvel_5730 / organism=Chromera_velia_CCMP2878 / gene_product=Transmission-blocking target antigen S230, putative / transcript_product=Transmission-blocking target antigen S230, putative / location=Cvel_scaffold271:90247-100206(-) / protein_length=571 / sequence_SO=supercontig / SO=protein_coding / is_pseudo=false
MKVEEGILNALRNNFDILEPIDAVQYGPSEATSLLLLKGWQRDIEGSHAIDPPGLIVWGAERFFLDEFASLYDSELGEYLCTEQSLPILPTADHSPVDPGEVPHQRIGNLPVHARPCLVPESDSIQNLWKFRISMAEKGFREGLGLDTKDMEVLITMIEMGVHLSEHSDNVAVLFETKMQKFEDHVKNLEEEAQSALFFQAFLNMKVAKFEDDEETVATESEQQDRRLRRLMRRSIRRLWALTRPADYVADTARVTGKRSPPLSSSSSSKSAIAEVFKLKIVWKAKESGELQGVSHRDLLKALKVWLLETLSLSTISTRGRKAGSATFVTEPLQDFESFPSSPSGKLNFGDRGSLQFTVQQKERKLITSEGGPSKQQASSTLEGLLDRSQRSTEGLVDRAGRIGSLSLTALKGRPGISGRKSQNLWRRWEDPVSPTRRPSTSDAGIECLQEERSPVGRPMICGEKIRDLRWEDPRSPVGRPKISGGKTQDLRREQLQSLEEKTQDLRWEDVGSPVGKDPGSLVGEDPGSPVGEDSGSLVGEDSGSLVGENLGSPVGEDSGSLVGEDSGSLV